MNDMRIPEHELKLLHFFKHFSAKSTLISGIRLIISL